FSRRRRGADDFVRDRRVLRLAYGHSALAPSAPTVERRKVFGEMAHQLIIVGRDDPGLYEALCADWAGDKDVAVIFDRRVGQRRRAALPDVRVRLGAAVVGERRIPERATRTPGLVSETFTEATGIRAGASAQGEPSLAPRRSRTRAAAGYRARALLVGAAPVRHP